MSGREKGLGMHRCYCVKHRCLLMFTWHGMNTALPKSDLKKWGLTQCRRHGRRITWPERRPNCRRTWLTNAGCRRCSHAFLPGYWTLRYRHTIARLLKARHCVLCGGLTPQLLASQLGWLMRLQPILERCIQPRLPACARFAERLHNFR